MRRSRSLDLDRPETAGFAVSTRGALLFSSSLLFEQPGEDGREDGRRVPLPPERWKEGSPLCLSFPLLSRVLL